MALSFWRYLRWYWVISVATKLTWLRSFQLHLTESQGCLKTMNFPTLKDYFFNWVLPVVQDQQFWLFYHSQICRGELHKNLFFSFLITWLLIRMPIEVTVLFYFHWVLFATMYVTTEIFVILFLFKCVFCTLTPVARVIHTLRNFLFKNQSNVVREFCKFFWAYCFVFLSVVKLLYKRVSNHLQLQFIVKLSQEIVKI